VLRRVLEKKEPLRQLADEYHVSHETIRYVILAAAKEHVQHASQLDHLS
jgi:orotate phosphoribosyltransferase-like protein